MKHFTWVLFLILSILLVGCVEKPTPTEIPEEITYKYTYDLTLENYTQFIAFRHRHQDQVGSEKQLEVFFETKYPNSVMIDIEAIVLLQTQVTILDTTIHTDTYSIDFTEYAQTSEVLSYSGIKTFVLVALTEITGKVMTNDETVENANKANLNAKQGLETMLEKFNQTYNTLFFESYVHVTEGGETTSSFVKNTYRAEPYYHEIIYSDMSGTIFMENSNEDIDVFYLSQYQTQPYIQKIMVLDKTDLEDDFDEGLFELDDTWSYRIENGDFIVSGSKHDLLGTIIDDELLGQDNIHLINDNIEITFADLDTRLLVSIELWVGLRKITIETYYSFNTFNPVDTNTYRVLPPTDPNLANTPTDLSGKQEGFMIPGENHYYQIEVIEGTYVFDISYPLEIEVYDQQGNSIEPLVWLTNQTSAKKYALDAGIYYVRLYHGRNSIIHYSIQLFHLEALYEIIGSPSDMIELMDGMTLEIEGLYDEIYLSYTAPSDGEIVITLPDSAKQASFYVYNQSLVHIPVAYNSDGEIRVPVIEGMNQILFTVDGEVNAVIQVNFETATNE